MMQGDDIERELRARFDVLRADDARRAPSFASLMDRARSEMAVGRDVDADTAHAAVEPIVVAPRRHHLALWTLPLLVAAGITAVMIRAERQADTEFETLVSQWSQTQTAARSPTDGLLTVPGSEYLRGTPRIGAPVAAPTTVDAPGGASRSRSPS